MRLPLIVLYFTLFFSNHLFSQQVEIADTISYARTKAYEKNFDESNKLLTQFNLHHTDSNALRLQAQVLYWMKNFYEAILVYEKTLSLFPAIVVVKLDYGRVLFELGNYSKAKPLLEDFVLTDTNHAEANILLSYIDLWSGRINAAKKRALFLQKTYPGNKESADILNTIASYTAPYFEVMPVAFSDDQPLKGFAINMEGGKYFSGFLSPTIKDYH